MIDFFSTPKETLEQVIADAGFAPLHAKQLFRSFYRQAKADFSGETLPKKLVPFMKKTFDWRLPKIEIQQTSKYDHSVKFALSLHDNKQVEMVLMPEKNRITLCVSSQVGCRQACSFCHTGRMGLIRNLEPGEIIGQIFLANQWILQNPSWKQTITFPAPSHVTNVVFMGMGEPMDNVDSLAQSIKVMQDPLGLAIAPRKITVSTAGHIDGLNKFISHDLNTGIAISLHGTNNAERSKIMPISRTWSFDHLIDWVKAYTSHRNRHVLLQYTLISSVNDTEDHAYRLVEKLKGLKVKVNLIPFNQIDPSLFKSPVPESLHKFQKILLDHKICVMTRYSKGQDIDAACGQLVKKTQLF